MKGELATRDKATDDLAKFALVSVMIVGMASIMLQSFVPRVALAAQAQGRLDSFEVTAGTDLQSVTFVQACQSAVVHNDGDNMVYIWLNSPEGRATPVGAGESLPVDYYGQPVILTVFYEAVSGTSSIRIIGAY